MDPTELVEEHLFLAELIAFDYANIPGCRWDEARSEASHGLVRAAQAFDSAKGEFIPFASRVIRNALNTLYAKQLRLHRVFPKSLDEPILRSKPVQESWSSAHPHHPAGPDDVQREIRQRETGSALDAVMNLLSPRERITVEALKTGKSYSEVGEALGISKQAAHKSARSALGKLRSGLERLGFHGIASDGLLASCKKEAPPRSG